MIRRSEVTRDTHEVRGGPTRPTVPEVAVATPSARPCTGDPDEGVTS